MRPEARQEIEMMAPSLCQFKLTVRMYHENDTSSFQISNNTSTVTTCMQRNVDSPSLKATGCPSFHNEPFFFQLGCRLGTCKPNSSGSKDATNSRLDLLMCLIGCQRARVRLVSQQSSYVWNCLSFDLNRVLHCLLVVSLEGISN